jgi:hypothetical protein
VLIGHRAQDYTPSVAAETNDEIITTIEGPPPCSAKAKTHNAFRNSTTTVSGPAEPEASAHADLVAEKLAARQAVASAFTFNSNKAGEYDPNAALLPPEGAVVKAR